uniref:Polymeric immunoglobulin receptor n=1 Tax=Apteryx owenii TaxID=8824 RepID=A0A8B9PNQ9_APTOW
PNHNPALLLDDRDLAGSAPRPVQLVLGERRGSVAVRCPPGGVASGRRAFWCKWGKSGCALVADTDGYVGRGYEGRIFVKPPESSGAFKILINDLKREDSGVYGCGTGMPSGTDSPGTVELRVTAGRRTGDDQENGTFTVVMSNLREDDAGWYWCGAKSGHVEQTSPVKLHIQGGR